MAEVHSFPPFIAADAHVLILGSMPGAMSLRIGQSYAHPQNAFWKIMGDLIGAGWELDYLSRIERLKARGIGSWDVLKSCHRPGSLDSAIDRATIVPNELGNLYKEHPGITHVFFNGGKAAELYRRYVLPSLGDKYAHLQYERLPSTSPAHASLSYQQKLQAWHKILDVIN